MVILKPHPRKVYAAIAIINEFQTNLLPIPYCLPPQVVGKSNRIAISEFLV